MSKYTSKRPQKFHSDTFEGVLLAILLRISLFGLEIDRSSPTQTPAARNAVNRYTFLGRENQPETGYMDLMKRFYDPTIGRFLQVDPITDTQEEYSTYQYGWNNPILRSDPNGDCPSCLIGAIVGAAVEYGTQVATNAYKNGGLTKDSFTKNINLTAIGLAAVEGGVTQGASAGRRLLVKTAVTVANNIGEVSINGDGQLTGSIETNGSNIVKNTAIDAISDLTTGGIVNKSAKGGVQEVVQTVVGSEGNKLAKGVKSVLNGVGVDITRNINTTVKAASKGVANNVSGKAGDLAETAAKVVSNPTKDEIKNRTNR